MCARAPARVCLCVALTLQQGSPLPKQAVCTEDSSCHDVVAAMLSEHIKRVWVVDGEGRPIDTVSTTDVMSKIAPRDMRNGSVY